MSILDLWMPILASAILVWILSAMVWMVFGWHNSDYARTRDEEATRTALKGMSPGYYSVPYCADHKEMGKPEMKQKMQEGPVAFITVMPNGVAMGGKLVASFVFNLFVGVICAYFVSRTLTADSSYLQVFRISGAAAFAAYGIAYIQDAIWFGRPFGATAKCLLDALLYGLVTGGAFGWLAV